MFLRAVKNKAKQIQQAVVHLLILLITQALTALHHKVIAQPVKEPEKLPALPVGEAENQIALFATAPEKRPAVIVLAQDKRTDMILAGISLKVNMGISGVIFLVIPVIKPEKLLVPAV